jgi:hypothetical protein
LKDRAAFITAQLVARSRSLRRRRWPRRPTGAVVWSPVLEPVTVTCVSARSTTPPSAITESHMQVHSMPKGGYNVQMFSRISSRESGAKDEEDINGVSKRRTAKAKSSAAWYGRYGVTHGASDALPLNAPSPAFCCCRSVDTAPIVRRGWVRAIAGRAGIACHPVVKGRVETCACARAGCGPDAANACPRSVRTPAVAVARGNSALCRVGSERAF